MRTECIGDIGFSWYLLSWGNEDQTQTNPCYKSRKKFGGRLIVAKSQIVSNIP